ncbi:hypothetical protein [Streptomyces sp. NPDC001717]|uniref:hypothetical protein n=1 Tax=Streptomyces sp. NPDC001717 TaxID=3364604 RepID=UPI00367C74D6
MNIRHILQAAERDHALNGRAASVLLHALADIPYQQRTEPAVHAVGRRIGGAEFLRWLVGRRLLDAHWGDVKRTDALGALVLAREFHSAVPRIDSCVPTSTGYTRAWANRRAAQEVDGRSLSTALRLAYQQIFDPQFPQVWQQWLARLADEPDGVPLARRLADVLDDDPAPAPEPYLVFRPVPDLRDPETVALLLGRETAADREAVARYAAVNSTTRDRMPGFSPEAIDDGVARRTLMRLWRTDVPVAEDAAAARGFRNTADAIDHMKVFLAGFLADTPERTA